ncbi:AI-2E family transporter [Sphingomonas sp.]|jgi:predicted PurR-regulated permease PerM|uniref:AI-2E family transporter n=1 Tax=Sphingomonas sp. TaxID=28214 RepID=UPI002E305F84|nr:AI-2E family transporter [Sphingomonas sp.]HEX4694391.1 AI-2E family transporter [Sphingomonas sp.]
MAILSPDVRRGAIARIVLIFLLAALGLWIVFSFLPALIWAVVIAVAIDPLVQRTEARFSRPHPNLVAAGFTAAFAILVLAPIAFGVAQGAREAHDILTWVAAARTHGVPPPTWIAELPFGSSELAGWWQANLADPAAADSFFAHLTGATMMARTQLIGIGLIHRSVIFAFTCLTLFFLIRDRDTIVAQFRVMSARMLGPTGERIGHQALLSVRGTIDGLVLVGIGEGIVMTIVYFVLGVPHPILLGIATAIAAMIPFGAALMFAIGALMLLGQGAVGAAIAVAAIGLGVVFVADHFLRPVLIGGATRLPFLWVLIGILGGVETMGLLGLFVGPATMAVLVMLWREGVEGKPTVPVA